MPKADDHDLRDALAEEVETLEPSDELWNKIYKRSVVQQEKKRRPWLTGALAMGAAAAEAAVFLVNGQLTPGVQPPPETGPSILVAPVDNPPPQIRTFGGPDPAADRLSVRYNHTMYWHNGEVVPPDRAWQSGVDLAAVSQAVDGLVVLAYDLDAQAVATRTAVARALRSDSYLSTGLRIDGAAGAEGLKARMAAAAQGGADGCNLYNYGLVPAARLGWVRG
jgi:hypothetical protein